MSVALGPRIQLFSCEVQLPCAGGGKDGPPPLHPGPAACAPWNPDLMQPYDEDLAHMPLDNPCRLLLVRESLIYALPPRAIYARHPDQLANVALVYRMKRNLFKRLQHNQAIERLCYEGTLTHT
jgi:hypothetical protein